MVQEFCFLSVMCLCDVNRCHCKRCVDKRFDGFKGHLCSHEEYG